VPTITSIEPQKSKKRLNIFLDGKFGFGIDLETFVKLGLKVERQLSDDEVDKIVKESEFASFYDKILSYGSLRPRSEKEYKDWLTKHKVPESLHEELFNRLKRLEFLDDKKFAVWWVGQRKEFKSKSKRELVYELKGKGISKDIITEVLSEENLDEISSAKKLLEKKKYLWQGKADFVARKKMSEFLLRHGFGWDVINKLVKGQNIDDFD
jgi:regulatory protein